MDKIDGALFAFAGLSVIWLAYLLLVQGIRPGWPMLLLVLFWVVVTYLLLPRLHRILTRVYVPGYFIGRARTSDGLLGDPVNVALLGEEEQVHAVMTAAGWTRADDLSLASGRKILTSTLSRRSYPQAPVSPLHLFDRQQDFAYQQEVAGSPSKRHHVRFWHCPKEWMLPGGYDIDWLAAGTYDRSVGLSLFTLQVTHKIEQDTDIERDFIVDSVVQANPAVDVRVISNFSTGYHARNGGGDLIETDGDLPIVDLTRVEAPVLDETERTDSRDKRPAQVSFGAVVSFVRAAGYLALGGLFLGFAGPAAAELGAQVGVGSATPAEIRFGLVVLGAILLAGGLLDVVLGLAVLFGHNWARLLLMGICVVTIIIAFTANAQGSQVVSLTTNLLPVSTSILVLLALSSHRARDYAVRGRHQPKRVAGRVEERAAF